MSFDALTIAGVIAAVVVVIVLYIACKLKGCSKPIC